MFIFWSFSFLRGVHFWSRGVANGSVGPAGRPSKLPQTLASVLYGPLLFAAGPSQAQAKAIGSASVLEVLLYTAWTIVFVHDEISMY